MPMLTASGRAFDPKCLAAGMMIEAVCLPDVAHSLGQICASADTASGTTP